MICPNCAKRASAGAAHCETCGADLNAPPPAPAAPRARIRSIAGAVLGAGGIATELAGAGLGNLFYVGVGYFACSMAFRLARGEELAWEDEEIAPGPKVVPFLTRAAKRLGIAGMAVGIPLAFAAWLRANAP